MDLTPEQKQVNELAEEFLNNRAKLPFSERKPELGKMINCPVCNLRHRSAKICTPVYATSRTKTVVDDKGETVPAPMLADQTTRKGVYGAAAFRGRIKKHRNRWGLLVLERATKIYNKEMSFYPSIIVDAPDATEEEKKSNQEFRDKIGKQSLSRARNELRKEGNFPH